MRRNSTNEKRQILSREKKKTATSETNSRKEEHKYSSSHGCHPAIQEQISNKKFSSYLPEVDSPGPEPKLDSKGKKSTRKTRIEITEDSSKSTNIWNSSPPHVSSVSTDLIVTNRKEKQHEFPRILDHKKNIFYQRGGKSIQINTEEDKKRHYEHIKTGVSTPCVLKHQKIVDTDFLSTKDSNSHVELDKFNTQKAKDGKYPELKSKSKNPEKEIQFTDSVSKKCDQINAGNFEAVAGGGTISNLRDKVAQLSPWKSKGKNGYSEIELRNGDIFRGHLLDGRFEGRGVMEYVNLDRYEGDFHQGLRHGKGQMIYINGDIYVGNFIKDLPHGPGHYVYENGDCYEGQFYRGKFHGKGIFRQNEGVRCEGEFLDDEMSGKGQIEYPDKSEYCGDLQSGQITGYGTFMYSNRDRYEGEVKEGKRHGKGKYTFSSGNIYEGDWVEDEMHGKGSFHYSNGDTYTGDFEWGLRAGEGTYWSESKKEFYTGGWVENQRHGKGKWTFQGGTYQGLFLEDVIQ